MAETDNSFLGDKVEMRANHLPKSKGEVRVLDCFHGSGLIWAGVSRHTNKKISVLAMEKKEIYDFHLPGDNISYLMSIDLSRFDVIDLDAYGVPYEQLKIIFERGFRGTVFATFIQSVYGSINHHLLTDLGFTEIMINKSPAILYKRGWEYFMQWLASHGVTDIFHRSKGRKHYLGFIVA